jgi:outer membrane immunogenic protein
MRKLFVACVALSALAAPAFAADMATKAPAPPPYMPPPAPMWTGWYIGANLGGSFGTASDSASIAGVPVGGGSPSLDGVVGGGQIGYNWQANAWVFGLEADIQATSEDGSNSASETVAIPGALATTGTLNYSEKLPWFGTVRGRLGVLANPNWLLYTTGGLAYGEVDTNTALTAGALGVSNNFDTTRLGWTVGGGVEAWLSRNWTAKVEYLYVDLGSFSNTFTGVTGFTPVTLSTHVTDNIVRAGLNYHFGGPSGY